MSDSNLTGSENLTPTPQPIQTPPIQPPIPQQVVAPSLIVPPPPPPPTPHKTLKWLAITFAALIPISVVAYVLYWNFLPFGYSKTLVLNVGSLNDTTGEFYLEGSKNLSDRKSSTSAEGTTYTYRLLSGSATAIFKPTAVLKNAKLSVSIQGDDVVLIPAALATTTLESMTWDNSWDFTNTIPSEFTGNVFNFDGSAYFDGKSSMYIQGSEDDFETGPFSVAAEWLPQNGQGVSQEIIGHFNWEIYQNKDSISFQVGRMDNETGPFYTAKFPLKSDFFNKKHSLIATYSPSTDDSHNGYIEIYVDGKFGERVYIGQSIIWTGYGKIPLTLGKTAHNDGNNPNFNGSIYSAKFASKPVVENSYTNSFTTSELITKIIISSTSATGTIRTLTLKVNE